MKVKTTFQWTRTCSAIPGPINVPAGAPVEVRDGVYWVKPDHFFSDLIVYHDAVHYGCRVQPDNVEPS
jgi:hypothetical protein